MALKFAGLPDPLYFDRLCKNVVVSLKYHLLLSFGTLLLALSVTVLLIVHEILNSVYIIKHTYCVSRYPLSLSFVYRWLSQAYSNL